MYAYLKGSLVGFTSMQAIIDVQGVGYTVFIPCHALGHLPALGQIIQFHTSFVVREFSHALYGFLTSEERDVFEVLMNITGVGPKLALSLIGHLPWNQLQVAIMNEDVTALCKVPGVGKKTAERLIIELRDKVPASLAPQVSGLMMQMPPEADNGRIRDAILALVNLGYNQANAQKAIKLSLKDLPTDYDLPELLKIALQNIHKS
jgi:Holliday junction DNA helicase RuvA